MVDEKNDNGNRSSLNRLSNQVSLSSQEITHLKESIDKLAKRIDFLEKTFQKIKIDFVEFMSIQKGAGVAVRWMMAFVSLIMGLLGIYIGMKVH